MTQLSVAPAPMPGIAPAQAAAADASTDPAGGADAPLDFAAVLKAQIGLPAKGASATDIFAALLPPGTTEAEGEPLPTEELPLAPDLAALLPALAGLMPPPATEAAFDAQPRTAEGGGELPAPALAPNAVRLTANPVPPAAAALFVEEPGRPSPQPAAPPAGAAAAPPLPVEMAAATALEIRLPAADAEQAHVAAQATQAAATLTHAAPDGEAPSVVRVDAPVGGRGWDAEVAQKIVLLANRQESRAELTLTPPHMGKVEITLSVNGDQTSAAFVSASPAAREALEQALPRLREILAEAGITLGQASVNAESARQDRNGAPAEQHGRDADRGGATAGTAAPVEWLRRSNGLVDTFA